MCLTYVLSTQTLLVELWLWL